MTQDITSLIEKLEGECKTCSGSGVLLALNSMFLTDGVRRYRCGICGGTGKSKYRSPDYEASQRRLREQFPNALRAQSEAR